MIRAIALGLLIGAAAVAQAKTPAAASGTWMPPEPPPVDPALHGMQYLYGSGEAAALSRQAWSALVGYAAEVMQGKDRHSVVLVEGSTLTDPKWESCGDKPAAAVFDVDETVLLNQGFEYDDLTGAKHRDFDDRWAAWERTGIHAVTPTPGAKEALAALRKMGVAVIFNTNRNSFNAAPTEQALNDAGIGPAVHGKTLYLQGDDQMGGMKDGRRWAISKTYCVIAMGGDQLGDFTDLFNEAPSVPARRAATALPGIAPLWGRGWFVLPNPVYGTGLQGGGQDIFPADKQWTYPAAAPATAKTKTTTISKRKH